MAWLPSQIKPKLFAPQTQRGKAVFLNLKSQPASIIWHPRLVITWWTQVDCVNTRAQLPPESSMQRIFPNSPPLGTSALGKYSMPIISLFTYIPTQLMATDSSRNPLWWNNLLLATVNYLESNDVMGLFQETVSAAWHSGTTRNKDLIKTLKKLADY